MSGGEELHVVPDPGRETEQVGQDEERGEWNRQGPGHLRIARPRDLGDMLGLAQARLEHRLKHGPCRREEGHQPNRESPVAGRWRRIGGGVTGTEH